MCHPEDYGNVFSSPLLFFAVLWLIEIALSSVCAVWLCENYVVVVPDTSDNYTSPSCEGLSTAHKNVILGEMMKLRAENSCVEWDYREGLKRGSIVESDGRARMYTVSHRFGSRFFVRFGAGLATNEMLGQRL